MKRGVKRGVKSPPAEGIPHVVVRLAVLLETSGLGLMLAAR